MLKNYIQTQIILGMRSDKLRRYCFTNKNIDTPKILSQGKLFEEITFQVDTIQGTENASENNMADEIHALREEINSLKMKNKPRSTFKPSRPQTSQPSRKCYNCGGILYPYVVVIRVGSLTILRKFVVLHA